MDRDNIIQALRTVYNNYGAEAFFADSTYITTSLREMTAGSDDTIDALRFAIESGIGNVYLPFVRQNMIPDRGFRKIAVQYLVSQGLSNVYADYTVGLLNDMLGWEGSAMPAYAASYAQNNNPYPQKSGSKKKKTIIAVSIAVVSVLAIAAVVVFVVLPNINKSNKKSNRQSRSTTEATSDTYVETTTIVTSSETSNTVPSQITSASSEITAMTTAAPGVAGFAVTYKGQELRVNAEMNKHVAAFDKEGVDYVYFEAPSCAGVGMSKTYTFGNGAFVVSTIPSGDIDIISSIVLFDNSVKTAEGIYIGCTKDQVIKTYGTPSSDIESVITYELNDTMLVFMMDEYNKVSGIMYNAII